MRFEEIYSKFNKQIMNYVIQKVLQKEIAEELTSDIFMKVYKRLDTFDVNKAQMTTWIYNIAKNTVIDYYRKVKLVTTSLDMIDSEGHNDAYANKIFNGAPSTNPHLVMVSKENYNTIQVAIVRLPKKLKRISNLFFNHNYKMKDIAVMTNKPLGTVKVNIHSARKILQKDLVNI